jgi:DNA transposition AAA+ family ATPase
MSAAPKNSQPQEKINYRNDLWVEGFPFQDPNFVETTISKMIWGVLDYCHETPDMGLVIGSSGLGKSRALQQYKRKHYFPAIITCSITTRSLGSILHQLADQLGKSYYRSNYDLAQSLTHDLERHPRLLVFDDCHFLRWELFELARDFYDLTRSGVVFVGQETLYDKMIGSKRSYQWDQIVSRIGVCHQLKAPTAEDISLICRGIFPDLDEKSFDYLHNRAMGPGKLRAAVKCLEKAAQVHTKEGIPLDVKLLKKIDEIMSLKRDYL